MRLTMSHSNENGQIFFLDLPALDELCSVLIVVPTLENCNSIPYCPHIIRCRELIFTDPDIIATPLLNLDRHIQIIMKLSYYKTGRLQARLKKIGIEMKKPHQVTAAELQACINYTIQARVAPLWNKCGDLLIEGRDFLTTKDRMRAVNFELNINQQQAYVVLKGHNVRSQQIQLSDLDISPPLIQEFNDNYPHGTLKEYYINRKWCHILPSMKKGQVIQVHQVLPHDSPFRSYKDMKRYWKNTYGYRLPESTEGMLFFQVYFRLVGEKLFTYPQCCLRTCPVTYLPSGDDGVIIQRFLHDLTTKVPSLCGYKMRIVSAVRYPEPSLTGVLDIRPGCVPNLISHICKPDHLRAAPPPRGLLTEGQVTIVQASLVQVPDSMRLDRTEESCHSSVSHGTADSSSGLISSSLTEGEQVVPQVIKTKGTDRGTTRPVFEMMKLKGSSGPDRNKPKQIPVFKTNVCKEPKKRRGDSVNGTKAKITKVTSLHSPCPGAVHQRNTALYSIKQQKTSGLSQRTSSSTTSKTGKHFSPKHHTVPSTPVLRDVIEENTTPDLDLHHMRIARSKQTFGEERGSVTHECV